jgi:hypothetical protein
MIQTKPLAWSLSVLMIAAVLWPIRQNWRINPRDDFPLSYYPMFSARRSQKLEVTYLVGFDAHGNRAMLPYTFVGTGGFNQVRRQIGRIVERGDADQLCRIAAAALAGKRNDRYAGIVEVQLVQGTYRLLDYFNGHKQPLAERVLASYSIQEEVV